MQWRVDLKFLNKLLTSRKWPDYNLNPTSYTPQGQKGQKWSSKSQNVCIWEFNMKFNPESNVDFHFDLKAHARSSNIKLHFFATKFPKFWKHVRLVNFNRFWTGKNNVIFILRYDTLLSPLDYMRCCNGLFPIFLLSHFLSLSLLVEISSQPIYVPRLPAIII